ncbi:MAG: FliA/WhiG family RNA polymerase sigma factor [Candidatus Lambdaproteobacteria bacterium]|nr:FliA/WhiG family RNA polymerase sigma factor [Candidatus Lambdaproteobacteria bacterium]
MINTYAQRAYRGKSREEVVLEYAPMVKQIANRLAARLPDHLDREDLVQAGMIGLLDAIEKYDPTREAQFRTYAEFRIRGAMLDDLRACDWIPRSVRENADRIAQAQQAIQAQTGRHAEEPEIAAALGLSLNEYHDLLLKARTAPLLSIEELQDYTDDGSSGTIFDVLEDPSCSDPLDVLALDELRARLRDAIARLPEKERLVLSLYYNDGLNLKEIGQVLGLTESRVCQIRTQAVLRLRPAIKAVSSVEFLDHIHDKRSG